MPEPQAFIFCCTYHRLLPSAAGAQLCLTTHFFMSSSRLPSSSSRASTQEQSRKKSDGTANAELTATQALMDGREGIDVPYCNHPETDQDNRVSRSRRRSATILQPPTHRAHGVGSRVDWVDVGHTKAPPPGGDTRNETARTKELRLPTVMYTLLSVAAKMPAEGRHESHV